MLLLSLLACGWNLPDRQVISSAPLWDARSAVPTEGAVTLTMPRSGGVVRVPTEGEPVAIDIGEGRITLLQGVEGSDALVALVDRTSCDEEDERRLARMDQVSDCPSDQQRVNTEVLLLAGEEVLSSVPIDGRYNRLSFSEDARFAVAYLDLSDPALVLRGVIDLTSVVVLDLERGNAELVNVGFAADQIRFQTDAGGTTTGAVVLSQNAVAQLDLLQPPFEVQTTFNLTLDPDTTVIPTSVDLTPNGQFALITVAGQADLYALDLVDHSINLLELAGQPSDVEVCESADLTVVVFQGEPSVQVIEHERFEIDTYALDEPMTDILEGEGFVVLYATDGRKDAYRLDLVTGELVEYRLENPPIAMQLAPTGEFAVAFTRPESNGSTFDGRPGMEVIDLLSDDTRPYLLEGLGVGLAFAETDGRLDALVLQQDVPYVYQLDLYTGEAITHDLELPPIDLGTLPAGNFFITHDSGLGAISFLNPATGEITSQHGFATLGLLDTIDLVEAP